MANADRMTVSSSLGSVNMMMSESSSSSSDDDVLMDADDIDDSILTTPQVNKMNGPFGGAPQPSPGNGWVGPSPAVNSLMNFARLRSQKGKSRKSSSSGSGNSMVSPSSKSPPTMRNVDINNGYFGREMTSEASRARRESISWAANQLHISGSESDDGTLKSTLENTDGMPVTPGRDAQRGVIRRAVTRRGNMLVSNVSTTFGSITDEMRSPRRKALLGFEQRLLKRAPPSRPNSAVKQKLYALQERVIWTWSPDTPPYPILRLHIPRQPW